jgi:aerobic-type carbon monoxide dehydrogenase small subunit (CoxS/CutS family)
VETVEGLSDGDSLGPLQAALADHHGLQCGFCTPGFLMVATELLAEGRDLDEHEVRERLSGNMCRCTGYQGIVEAVLAVARRSAPPA